MGRLRRPRLFIMASVSMGLVGLVGSRITVPVLGDAPFWIELGQDNIGELLELSEGSANGETVADHTAGRSCRRTDHATQNWFMCFDLDDAAAGGGDGVWTIEVTYFDDAGRFSLEYDSTDESAPAGAQYKRWGLIRKTATGAWRTAVVTLYDAAFANRQEGHDFRLCSFGWLRRGENELTVSRVAVSQAAIVLEAEPDLVVADGKTEVSVIATVRDHEAKPVPDGTVVNFEANRGAIEPQAETRAGKAAAVLRPPAETATATVTAQCQGLIARTPVHLVEGQGGIDAFRYVIETFEYPSGALSLSGPGGPDAQLSVDRDRPEARGYGILQFDVTKASRPVPYIELIDRKRLNGLPVGASLWMGGEGLRLRRVKLRLLDAEGEDFDFVLARPQLDTWLELQAPLTTPEETFGGDQDQLMDLPAALQSIIVEPLPSHQSGRVYLGPLTVECRAPESRWLHMDVALRDPQVLMGKPAAVQVGLANALETAREVSLKWALRAVGGEEILAHGEASISLPAADRVVTEIPLELTTLGDFVLEVQAVSGQAQETRSVRFRVQQDA